MTFHFITEISKIILHQHSFDAFHTLLHFLNTFCHVLINATDITYDTVMAAFNITGGAFGLARRTSSSSDLCVIGGFSAIIRGTKL